MRPQRIGFFGLLLSSLLVAAICLADEPRRVHAADARKAGVGQNLGFVEKLIHESAASKQIQQSDNTEAKALRAEALTHLGEAKAAESQGNSAAAVEALDKAKKAIFTAMRLIGGKAVKNKRQGNYNNKLKSLESLMMAHQRIGKESDQEQAAIETENHVKAKMQEAQAHYDKGEMIEARDILNNAYLSLKLSLTHMRDGKKLVRSLHFETKEDEYRYELRRNDTHNMLINTVLKEKRADPRLGKLMDIPLNAAEKFRTEAEQQAAAGNFESAIKTMEQSTKDIIRAIRMAGIFIPG